MDDIYDRMVFPDKTYDFITGKAAFLDRMISYFPKEEQAIRNYMNLVNQISKKSLSYYSNKGLSGLLAYMSYPFMSKPFLEYAGRSTRDVLTELGCSIELMGVLTLSLIHI